MALNLKYIPFEYLQEYFVDKSSGLPLSAGVVKFYRDSARTTPKSVYKLSGNPAGTYTDLGNTLVLTSVGTFQDVNTGDDINVYGYPYDANDNVDLYYITVDSAGGVRQFTRVGEPNIGGSGIDTAQEAFNYVSNGQFLLGNYIPPTSTTAEGQITQAVTNIAPGGWTFERNPGSTALDYVIFNRYGSYTSSPSANPRYSLEVKCTSPGTDTYKGVRLKFRNVNRFASTDANKKFRIYFEAKTLAAGSSTIYLDVTKYFGVGGSSGFTENKTTFTLTSTLTKYQYAFSFGDNSLYSIGPGDDDYVQVDLDFNPTQAFDISINNVLLTDDNGQEITSYPELTNAEYNYKALAGWLENEQYPINDVYYNRYLGLPVILKSTGLGYDTSEIGKVYQSISETPGFGELLTDGEGYPYESYSADLIPYKRLGDKLWNSTANIYKYGTGANFISAAPDEVISIRIMTNTAGVVTLTSDGTGPLATGFTFTRVHAGVSGGYKVKSYIFGGSPSTIILENLNVGTVTASAAGTSGFVVTQFDDSTKNPFLQEKTGIITTTAVGLGGKYWTFVAYDSGPVPYYVWYRVSGSEPDPAPGGTGILVKVESSDYDTLIASKTREALNGWEDTLIEVPSGASSMPAGCYFNVYAVTNTGPQLWIPWYKINGAGSAPVIANAKFIEIDLNSSDTATQIATKTQIAINKKFYAVPKFNGLILRAWDNGAGVDPDADKRWSMVPGISGDVIGTEEDDDIRSHFHNVSTQSTAGSDSVYAVTTTATQLGSTKSAGGSESRPKNSNINYVIKY